VSSEAAEETELHVAILLSTDAKLPTSKNINSLISQGRFIKKVAVTREAGECELFLYFYN